MRVAWLRPAARSPVEARLQAALGDELARRCTVDAFDERTAHDFVWQHDRQPYDLCLYQIGGGPSTAFTRAYLGHVPGVVILRGGGVEDDVISAARMILVADAPTAESVAADHPHLPVRMLPIAAPSPSPPAGSSTAAAREARIAVLAASSPVVVTGAVSRARESGATVRLVEVNDDVDRAIADADIVMAMRWPPFAPLTDAALAMAAGKAVVVFECGATAGWPALDPQTWQPRGYGVIAPPIAVSIDPRDEEHSLMLAIRRLAADPALRASLGTAARAWWMQQTAAAWDRLLDDAVKAPVPDRA